MSFFPFKAKLKETEFIDADPFNDPDHSGMMAGEKIKKTNYIDGFVLNIEILGDSKIEKIETGYEESMDGYKKPVVTDAIASISGVYAIFAELKEDGYSLSVESIHNIIIDEKYFNDYIKTSWQRLNKR